MECSVCGVRNDDKTVEFRKRELRPYGPGGAMICYPCAHTPERRDETERNMGALMDAASSAGGGVATIGGEDGPRPGFNP